MQEFQQDCLMIEAYPTMTKHLCSIHCDRHLHTTQTICIKWGIITRFPTIGTAISTHNIVVIHILPVLSMKFHIFIMCFICQMPMHQFVQKSHANFVVYTHIQCDQLLLQILSNTTRQPTIIHSRITYYYRSQYHSSGL